MRKMRTVLVGAALGTAAVLGGVTPASAVTATVPNSIVDVYSCTYYHTGCRYSYSYQENGPYNASVPTVHRRVNSYDRWR